MPIDVHVEGDERVEQKKREGGPLLHRPESELWGAAFATGLLMSILGFIALIWVGIAGLASAFAVGVLMAAGGLIGIYYATQIQGSRACSCCSRGSSRCASGY